MTDSNTPTLAELDARVRELEEIQKLILRIMSTTKPLASLLETYGATETQELAFYKLLDDLVARIRGRADNRPSLGFFQMHMNEIFPQLRGNKEFLEIVIDTLKLDRPAYREAFEYMQQQGWLQQI